MHNGQIFLHIRTHAPPAQHPEVGAGPSVCDLVVVPEAPHDRGDVWDPTARRISAYVDVKVIDPLIQTRTHMHVRRAEHHDASG